MRVALFWVLPVFFFPPRADARARILVYSATREFRHDSIPTAVAAIKSLSSKLDAQIDHTEDQSYFRDSTLTKYDLLVFLDNTGEVLDATGQAALQTYLNAGGNFMGIHAASDCLRTSVFYENAIGAHFDAHPAIQNATINVLESSHPATSMLPKQWLVRDEIYNFKSDPRSLGAKVLLSPDESSYTDDTVRKYNQGSPHPIAWYQDRESGSATQSTAGRSFYTALGHLNETWQDPLFLSHIQGGLWWTLRSNTTRAFNATATLGDAGTSSSRGEEASQSLSSSGSTYSLTSLTHVSNSPTQSASTSMASNFMTEPLKVLSGVLGTLGFMMMLV